MNRSILFLLLGCCRLVALAQTPAQPNTYALIIGLSEYKEIVPLQFADRDATAFAGFLTTQHVPEANIKLFLNQEATRLNILDELSSLTQTLNPHDRFYFYFGGHGDLEAKIGAENALLLLYYSYKSGYFKGNEYLQLSELKSWFDALAKKQVEVIFIADACHSGGLIGGKDGVSKTQQALQARWAGITKLLSCRADEYSLEGKQWGGGRGLFSYHLVNGLTGRADANKDKQVSLGELETYLTSNVVKEANPNVQTPVVLGDAGQLLATVSAAGLVQLADEEQRQVPVITEVNLKGDNERATAELMSKLDTSLVNTYKRFTKALREKRVSVYDDSTDNALLHYRRLTARSIPANLVQLMKRNLGAGLMERELDIMRESRIKGKGFFDRYTDPKKFSPAIANLQEVMNLFGPGHFLYNNLKARQLILEYFNPQPAPSANQSAKRKEKLFEGLRLEPNMVSTFAFLSTYYRVRDNADSAIYYSDKVLDLLPNQTYAYLNSASNYMFLKYRDANNKQVPHPKVIQYLEKCIELDPTFLQPYSMLGELYLVGKIFNGQDTIEFHDYPKSIYYYEKALTFHEMSEDSLLRTDFNNASASNKDLDNRMHFGLQNKYYAILYFLHKATGNLKKSTDYLDKLNRKIDIVSTVDAYLAGVYNMYSLCYYDKPNNAVYLKHALDFLKGALKKSGENLKIASKEDKPLLTLKYRELLKGIGATNRSVKNYTEAEAVLRQALAYPILDFPVKISLKLGEYDLNEFSGRLLSGDYRIAKNRSGEYEYRIDANAEMFLLKLDQNMPDEAMGWLEKALQNSVYEKGNGVSSKSFTEMILKTYKNVDKEAYMALLNKYFPHTADKK